MDKSGKYYIVKERALPEVLLKVVEAKRLIDSEKAMTVQEATDATGISRSSFISTKMISFLFMRMFMDEQLRSAYSWMMSRDYCQGYWEDRRYRANILTIHQAIPINGVASLTLSIDVLPTTGDFSALVERLNAMKGIHDIKILGRE